ncbi:MAG: glycosyltransferase family 39 protein [Fimbriiglobus sp.]
MRTSWAEPLLLAAALTVLNAAKPAAVDDAAYLIFAEHLVANPADPYGFELFWSRAPKPAMEVLLPPVVPYWLSLGLRLFGDHLFLLKLWLFPFAAVFAVALAALLRRFAPGYARPALAMTVLGPAVLPMFGVMLDVPALALALASVACFVRGCDRGRVGWVVMAGLLAGLAMQTKYSALTALPVIAWYGLLSRRRVFAAVAVGVGVGGFAAWEGFLHAKYGESHFVHHVLDQEKIVVLDADDGTPPPSKWKAALRAKADLFQPMLGQLGGLAVGVGLVAAWAVGVNRWVLAAWTAIGVVGVAAVCVLPAKDAVLIPGKLDVPTTVFVTLGTGTALAVLAAATRLLWRLPAGRWPRPRLTRDDWFVVGWLFVELGGHFALTPFPAARRVMGLTIVGTFVAARLAAVASRANPNRRPAAWVPAVGVAAGLGLFAVDTWDALPEKVLAERAAAAIPVGNPARPHRVWFNGHWGFQYYCGRLGMVPVVPGISELRAGDWLVFPAIPDPDGFYRPYHGEARIDPDPWWTAEVAEFAWDDGLSAQTIPTLYGGRLPVTGRDHPRLRVKLYRVTREWVP